MYKFSPLLAPTVLCDGGCDRSSCAKEEGGGNNSLFNWTKVQTFQMKRSWWRSSHSSFCRSVKRGSSGRAVFEVIKYVYV